MMQISRVLSLNSLGLIPLLWLLISPNSMVPAVAASPGEEEEPIELQCFTCSTDVHAAPNPSTGNFHWVGVGDTPQEAKANARAEMAADLQAAYDAVEGDYACDYCDSTIPSCLKYKQDITQGAGASTPSPANGPPFISIIVASFVGFSVCCTECTNPL